MWSRDEASAVLTVADEGPGIAAEHRERVFHRFFRLDEARSRDAGGTGLGLAIAKWAVEINGGTISVDGRNRGRFRIPYRPAVRDIGGERLALKGNTSHGGGIVMKRFFGCGGSIAVALASVAGRRMCRLSIKQVLTTLGKQGDYKANVLKVNIPRNDLSVTVANVKTPTPFGFGGWVAMTKGTGGMDVMMGDLVLTQDEVNPVMSALLDNGLEVTALHNHFFWDEPRMFYMHVHGHGSPRRAGAQGEARTRSDRKGRPAGRAARPRGTPRAGARDRHGEDRADRRDQGETERARSTRSRSAATT